MKGNKVEPSTDWQKFRVQIGELNLIFDQLIHLERVPELVIDWELKFITRQIEMLNLQIKKDFIFLETRYQKV